MDRYVVIYQGSYWLMGIKKAYNWWLEIILINSKNKNLSFTYFSKI